DELAEELLEDTAQRGFAGAAHGLIARRELVRALPAGGVPGRVPGGAVSGRGRPIVSRHPAGAAAVREPHRPNPSSHARAGAGAGGGWGGVVPGGVGGGGGGARWGGGGGVGPNAGHAAGFPRGGSSPRWWPRRSGWARRCRRHLGPRWGPADTSRTRRSPREG